MTKNTLIFLFVVVITSTNIFAQTVSSSHIIEATGQPNEFLVKTAITGLENVDIARIEYDINDAHTYTPSPNNSFFTDRKNNQLKFYLMAVPASGIINIEFILTISNGQTLNIPAAIQYSRNEVKDKVALAPLTINIGGSTSTLASTTPEVEEEAEATEETTTPVESEKEEEEEIVSEIIEETKEEVEEESSTPVIKETPEGETTPPAETIYKKPEEKPKPTPTNTSSKKQYGIQILALSEYSETRVRNFCKQHGLDYNLISKENIDGLTKIRYGKSTSATEVQTLKEELINKGLKGVFMVALP
jgi:cell division septation protein DedD